jgi:dTDP-glucose 4,6-dehydratase
MRILVTGGMGFIGSNFIKYMLNKRTDYEIINYDKLTYAGNPENLKDIENNLHYFFVKGDISNYKLIEQTIHDNEIDSIINFAAESHVDRSILDPNIFVETNIKGAQTLLNAAKNNKIKKFIQISTDEVYGSLNFHDPPFTEQSPLQPSSPYSASKAGADLLALSYYKTFDLNVCITRCSNNYGPYQFPEKMIPLMINNIRNDKKLPVYGDGKNVRDWIFVDDHCSGILVALEKGKPGGIYNFGGSSEISNLVLVKNLLEIMKKGEDLISFVKDRAGHDRRYAIDYSKAKKELGWNPEYNFENGIQKTIDWYLSNSEWLDSVINGEYQDYYQKVYGDK